MKSGDSNNLTKRQGEILEFITSYLRGNGYPPTIREIGEAFGFRSNRGVVDHLRALERKGCIRRNPGSSRAIELLANGKTWEFKDSCAFPGDGSEVRAGGNLIADDSRTSYYQIAGDRRVRYYPVAGRIEAGVPSPPIEDRRESMVIDDGLFGGEADFFLKVTGESMVGDHIVPGDLLVVKRTESCGNGDIVVAMIDGETTVKRFFREGDRVILRPANPAYAPIILDGSAESRSCTIVGIVLGLVRRCRSRPIPFSG